ncbi:MAG: hypothetical protein ACRDS1_07575 [Pseudonocardiaceae bacterium]
MIVVASCTSCDTAIHGQGKLELTDPALRWSPGAVLCAIGLAGASGIAIMQRRGLLTRTDPAPHRAG